MDEELLRHLTRTMQAAETAAANSEAEVDFLPIRNEIEDMEGRLSTLTREIFQALADSLESNLQAIQHLQEQVDAIAGTVDVIQAELPSE